MVHSRRTVGGSLSILALLPRHVSNSSGSLDPLVNDRRRRFYDNLVYYIDPDDRTTRISALSPTPCLLLANCFLRASRGRGTLGGRTMVRETSWHLASDEAARNSLPALSF